MLFADAKNIANNFLPQIEGSLSFICHVGDLEYQANIHLFPIFIMILASMLDGSFYKLKLCAIVLDNFRIVEVEGRLALIP